MKKRPYYVLLISLSLCPVFPVPTRSKFTILSIDDDPEVANLLERSSHVSFPEASVIPIRSIKALNEYLQKQANPLPQLILLDLNVPDSAEGFKLLTQLRRNSPVQLIPIIILSVSDSDFHIQEAYFQGANAYMTKPESYGEWIRFMESLKNFWQQTATLPRL